MPSGVLFSVVAYALYSCCDAIIKGFGNTLSIFEIAFFSTLFSLLPAIFAKPRGEHWRSFWRMRHPWLVQLRSLTGVLGNLSIIYAFTHIPLAEVYSLSFLAPVFIVILSVLVLKETVRGPRWIFLAASFLGVLLVVRPGFRELQLGHLMAIGAALFGSVTTLVLRSVAAAEKRVSLIGVASAYILLVNGVLMIPGFQMPTLEEFGLFVIIGGLGGTGHILFIAATRRAEASQVAPAQYSQIVWAIVLGAVFYREYPDAIAYLGLAVVAAAGVLNVLYGHARIRVISRFGVGRVPLGANGKAPPRPPVEGSTTPEL
ncbi:MAG: DMT family transporter [Devosia sp.]|nr:DMT family transporter [Devosia sp.]